MKKQINKVKNFGQLMNENNYQPSNTIIGKSVIDECGQIGVVIDYDENEQQGPAFFKSGAVTVKFERHGKCFKQGHYIETLASLKFLN
jgi:hypothetical protein